MALCRPDALGRSASCYCSSREGYTLCAGKRTAGGTCTNVFSGAGVKNGATCKGYDEDERLTDGTFGQCMYDCADHGFARSSTSTCVGFTMTGQRVEGELVCPER